MYELVKVAGNDAESFLQGQLTQDLRLLGSDASLRAAWCNAKGRVFSTLRLLKLDAAIGLIVPDDLAAEIVQRLSMFVLRADVNVSLVDNWRCAAVSINSPEDAAANPGSLPAKVVGARADIDGTILVCLNEYPYVIEIMGDRIHDTLRDLDLSEDELLSRDQWHAAIVDSAFVRIDKTISESFTPHMLGLNFAGAISFEKGCYSGQEIVARTEHLGKSPRRLARFLCAADNAIGDSLTLDGDIVGTVVCASSSSVLAVVKDSIGATPLTLNGGVAVRAALSWETT